MRYVIYIIAILQTISIIALLNELNSHGFSSENMRTAYHGACEISKRVSSVSCETSSLRFKQFLDEFSSEHN